MIKIDRHKSLKYFFKKRCRYIYYTYFSQVSAQNSSFFLFVTSIVILLTNNELLSVHACTKQAISVSDQLGFRFPLFILSAILLVMTTDDFDITREIE